MTRLGVDRATGRALCDDDASAGAICSAVMMFGLKGTTPVFQKAESMFSRVKALT